MLDDNLDQDEQKESFLENFRKAGQIAKKIKKHLPTLLNPGESVLDIVETIEKMIKDEGGEPGFPVNISINSIAAHYTASIDDATLIGDNDIIKIDFGVAVNGCISDNAITIDLSEKNQKLLEASKEALRIATEMIKPGVGNGDIGKAIENKIKEYGFRPIENLTGHLIEPYNLHAGIDVPSVGRENDYFFKEGDVVAIEPFATDGAGRVVDTDMVEIYSVQSRANLRMRASQDLLFKLTKRYLTLPFAKRWIVDLVKTKLVLRAALNELVENNCLHPYYVLKEEKGGLVSQFEHTLIVQKDGAEVLGGD
jgi:methionine aminopeptidase, type II